ncbi:MAG: ScyD/ScyE family protein [Actinomycetota bacterium]|nr:ScyD/ScyE family protein [Actinomycetota bacterium]
MGQQRLWQRGVAAVGALGMSVLMTSPAGAEETTGSVSDPVIEGLIGPLGLDVSGNGTIYVAEAFAGQITRVLPSGARSVLFRGDSVSGVASTVLGGVAITLSTFPEEEAPPLDTTLELVAPNGSHVTLASLQDHEVQNNPDGEQSYGFLNLPAGCQAKLPPFLQPYTGIVESNPYKVATLGPISYAVADAAGNSIVRVTVGQQPKTVAVLPAVPQRITPAAAAELGLPLCTVGRVYSSEPVPTDVEVGPDGFWYVSSLPGVPDIPNTGSVFRVNPDTGAVNLVARGFSGAVDLAVAEDGTIYVAELNSNRISAISNGVVSTVVDVFSPGAVEIADDGTIYATTGVFGPSGAVVTVTP